MEVQREDLPPPDLAAAAASLREILVMIAARELAADAQRIAYLTGAVETLEELALYE